MTKSDESSLINLNKTYLTIFGRLFDKPRFVDELKIKWCVEFKLLGIFFDSTLSKMYINYEQAIESFRREINSWKFRFLTIFRKVTVIKTMCIPLLNHITAVVPNPSCTHLRSLELELKQFIASNNPSMVDDKTRIMSVRNGGSGVPNIKTFWKAIRMSWLRKSICLESSWFKLHRHDVYPNVFDPQKSNFESLTNAKSKCVNPFWKEVYSSMIECRLNVLLN